jgi:hypothetical protein
VESQSIMTRYIHASRDGQPTTDLRMKSPPDLRRFNDSAWVPVRPSLEPVVTCETLVSHHQTQDHLIERHRTAKFFSDAVAIRCVCWSYDISAGIPVKTFEWIDPREEIQFFTMPQSSNNSDCHIDLTQYDDPTRASRFAPYLHM